MEKREENLSLGAKEKVASDVIQDVFDRFSRPVVVWSAGKDSTVVLYLVNEYCKRTGRDMPPALFLDHGQHYDETFTMLEEVSKKWNFRVIAVKNDDFINHVRDGKVALSELTQENRNEAEKIGFRGEFIEYGLHTEVGNHLLKTVPMKNAWQYDSFNKYIDDHLSVKPLPCYIDSLIL